VAPPGLGAMLATRFAQRASSRRSRRMGLLDRQLRRLTKTLMSS